MSAWEWQTAGLIPVTPHLEAIAKALHGRYVGCSEGGGPDGHGWLWHVPAAADIWPTIEAEAHHPMTAQTQAGRQLIASAGPDWDPTRVVLAIEAEAIAQERERLATAVSGLPRVSPKRDDIEYGHVAIAAVLALLQGADR